MKKICVIGAGCSGLPAIKSCKEENLEVDCFEATDSYGGLWRYHNDTSEGQASVMKTTIINTSKEMTAYSDFPPPKEFPNFMGHSYVMEYFRLYAEHFDLFKHIRYNCKVVKVEMAGDYQQTGRWLVTVEDLKKGEMFANIYDGVMVCSGHHTYPHRPYFEGMEDFQGTIRHTHSLKTDEGFEDKNVLVIGIGNSGVDAAAELSRVSKKVSVKKKIAFNPGFSCGIIN